MNDLLLSTPAIELINAMILWTAVILGFYFLIQWRRESTLQRKELSMQSEALRRRSESAETQTNDSGYVKVDVPEEC